MFHGWTPSLSGPCFRGAVPVACLWLSLWVWAWSLFWSVSVAPGSALGSVPFRWGPIQRSKGAPTQKPAVICDHFMSGIPSCSMFWDFFSLHQKHRASAGHLVVYFVTGLMVGDRRFPGATILGARFSTSSANHPVSVPPTGPELADASLCGQCTSWQVLYSLMDLSSCAS